MRTAIVLAMLTLGCESSKNAPPSSDPNAELRRQVRAGPWLDVEPHQIAHAYFENALAAETQFKGKALRVFGKVGPMTTNAAGTPLITIVGKANTNVVCEFDGDRAVVEKLRRDEGRFVRGIGGDFTATATLVLRLCDVGHEPEVPK